ncbi:FAD-binding oxidoreductase [Pseudoxanthobacter sp.]|uniref:FAD-binding oxidoreductase n=1 Tax=Pseudoxanthobacter sp. TaxID=1925742 RepID=UPI002FE27AE0
MTDLARSLEAIVGPQGLRQGEAVDLLDPGWHPENLLARLYVAPADAGEVAAVLRLCRETGTAVVPQGGRTGLVGATRTRAPEVVLSSARMARILRLDPLERVAVVEAGVTLEALQQAAAAFGLEPGIDLAARGTATIGGMVSTNAGGIQAFRNGVMRHRVLGLEAVLADGTVVDDLTRIVKNATGYDVKQLFIGAEGTLGVVTKVAVKLDPLPAAVVTAMFGLPDTATALGLLNRVLAEGRLNLRAAEGMWQGFALATAAANGLSADAMGLTAPVYLILEAGGFEAGPIAAEFERLFESLCETVPDLAGVIAQSERQRGDIWKLREDTGAIYHLFPAAPSYDVSVPASEIEAYLARVAADLKAFDPTLDPFVFGHLGDGNLHIILNRAGAAVPPDVEAEIDAIVYSDVAARGGAFSAEHGIGLKRRTALARFGDAGKRTVMAALKRALDPDRILNPGKVLE